MRQTLNIGAAPGDGTGDPARTGGNKINLNFAELYAFLGGDTLTQTAGSVLLGNGTNPVTSFATTAGRLVIGNGGSGLTDDANLTWDAANKILTCGPTSPVLSQVGLHVRGALELDGDGAQLVDGSGNNSFRAVRTGCWIDGAAATFFEVGNSTDKIMFANLFGDTPGRLGFASLHAQFSSAGFSVMPVPSGIFQVDDGTNVALRVVSASSIFVGGSDPGGADVFRVNGSLTINSATMIQTKTAFTDGAAAAVGTLNNAPAAGDPTKWIPINDSGTTRYIPAW